MGGVDDLRKQLTAEGKAAAAACASLRTAAEAGAFEAARIAALLDTAERGEDALLALSDICRIVRSLPSVSTREPLAVLVGLPNVGKSSLVGALSSAAPEVNAYPFTTKRLTLGHLRSRGGLRLQIMDTPGVLARADTLRNAIEQLTFCALRELHPTVILYVIDPTGLGGRLSAVHEQLAVRAELRALHPATLWVDVLSKADVLHVAREGGDVGACGVAGARDEGPTWIDHGWANEGGDGDSPGDDVGYDDSFADGYDDEEATRGDDNEPARVRIVVESVAMDDAGGCAPSSDAAGAVAAQDAAAHSAAQSVLESAAALDEALAREEAGVRPPAYRVSVPTGEGIDELRAMLDGLIHAADERDALAHSPSISDGDRAVRAS